MQWELNDAKGEMTEIDKLIRTELEQIGTDVTGWTVFYQQYNTQEIWELSYPQGEMHGGGPRLLRNLGVANKD